MSNRAITITVKAHLQESLNAIRSSFLSSGDARAAIRARTDLVDSAVLTASQASLAPAFPEGLSLLAVGGYGRRELFPYSDIDLLILLKRAIDEPARKEAVSEFLRTLWDAGFKVSQSVRTPEECCTVIDGNLELSISLLDERCLGGDPDLYGRFRERFSRFLTAERRDLVRRLCRMARSRHARFHDTIYRLEPDVKESCGGLRDLQTAAWLRLLREAATEPPAPEAHAFLNTVRCFLHFRAGRDSNVLTFDVQDEIAEAAFSRWRDPAEYMRGYYRQARGAWREALRELEASEGQDRSLLANFRDWRSRLSNSDFTVSRDRVFLRNPHDLATDPGLTLRLCLFLARHGVAPALETEQRIMEPLAALRVRLPEQASSTGFWRAFLELGHAPTALRWLQDAGILAALIPDWPNIEHLVVRDYYHQYTVDEHTFVTLDVLGALAGEKEASAKRFALLLEESASDAWLLRLALLYHDIGKGSGSEHERRSLEIAHRNLPRMGVTGQDAAMVEYLIEHHLLLSSLLQSRDLGDPDTACHAAAKVNTIERLRLLTLMTFADISAVNGTAMNPWRMEQLWRLYRVTARELNRGLSDDRIENEAEAAFGPQPPEMKEFLEGLPSRYLWTHSPEDAKSHLELSREALTAGVALSVTRREGAWRLTLVTEDRPFLFASIAGALASFGLNILQAEAFANKRSIVVDTFVFSDPARTLELNPPEVDRLKQVLVRVAAGRVRAEELLKFRATKPPPARRAGIEPAVTADDESSASATIFEVVAQDRPGLLFSLTSALSRAGCNIEVVLVDTEAHKAIDVFHVTKDGRKLSAADQSAVRQSLLDACQPAST